MSSVRSKVSILWVIGLLIAMSQSLWAADPAPGDEVKSPPFDAPGMPASATPAAKVEKLQAASAVQAKSSTTALVTDPKELKRIVAERIDTMAVSDLKKKMARAQAVLSLEGQTILKDRAKLRRDADRLAADLKEFAQDTKIQDVEALLANDAFRTELLQALQIGDKKEQVAAIMEILNKNHVDVVSLKKVVVARKKKADADLCEKCLAGAESKLAGLQVAVGATKGADIPYETSKSLTGLASIYASAQPASGPTDASASDLADVLKALLTPSGEKRKPAQ